jgi:C1A family cysteine protease
MKKNIFVMVIILLTFIGCGESNGSSQNNQNGIASKKLGTGALFSTEEVLSQIPLAMPPLTEYTENQLPISFDLSDDMPPVRSQGSQGSCVSWAVGYYLKSYHEHIEKGSDYGIGNDYDGVYSPAFLYNVVKSNGCDGGSTIVENLDRVKNIGIATWKDMPYDEKDCDTQPSYTAIENSKCAKILSYERVEIEDIKYYISNGNPIIIAIKVYDNFVKPEVVNGEYFYKTYQQRGDQGGHAIVVVGYDNNRNAFKIINSWGRDWGNDGFLWIDYDVFSKIVREAYITEDAPNECEEGSSYISIDKQVLKFGNRLVNKSYKKGFKISNTGSVTLTIDSINVPDGYSVDWTNGTIEASKYKNITVTFTPTEEKSYNGVLTIDSDADNGVNSIQLSGEGIEENLPPVANAGEDITVKIGEAVTLDGSKSSDDEEIVSYEWKEGYSILSNSVKFTKYNFSEGKHIITLTVTDNDGATDRDTVIINILPKPTPNPYEDINGIGVPYRYKVN